jgi:hypothetical protein
MIHNRPRVLVARDQPKALPVRSGVSFSLVTMGHQILLLETKGLFPTKIYNILKFS